MLGMDAPAARPIRLGCFDVRDGAVVLADEALPIAVEADAASGAVTGVFTWPVAMGRRDRPMALDTLLLSDSIRSPRRPLAVSSS
jgi:hypothetical protein